MVVSVVNLFSRMMCMYEYIRGNYILLGFGNDVTVTLQVSLTIDMS